MLRTKLLCFGSASAHSRVIVAVVSWTVFLGCSLEFRCSECFISGSWGTLLLWKRCLRTLLQWLCTVFCHICTFLIHPFRITGSRSSLHASFSVFPDGFSQFLKPWLIRVVLACVNDKCISGSILKTNDWWCLVFVLSFHTCKVMIILNRFNADSFMICVTGWIFIIRWINLLIFIARNSWLCALI